MPLTTKEVPKKSLVGFSSTRYRLEVDEYLPKKKKKKKSKRQTLPASQKPWRMSRNQNQQGSKKIFESLIF